MVDKWTFVLNCDLSDLLDEHDYFFLTPAPIQSWKGGG
jgi:hypothetical protein